MDSTTRPDHDELAQEAPLVPNLGHTGRTTTAADSHTTPPRSQEADEGATDSHDELAQEAPLVPHLGTHRRTSANDRRPRR